MYLLQPFRADAQWERLAMRPSDPEGDAGTLLQALEREGPRFGRFLVEFDLAPVWHAALASAGRATDMPADCDALFRQARAAAAARYLAQRAALQDIDRILGDAGIVHAVMKGAAVREELHKDASVLLASDVDVLVAPANRVRAAALLVQAGFALRLDPVNISHEVVLQDSRADIDLHWHMLRPGRTRIELTEGMLQRRVRRNGVWTLCDSDCTFVMLTHPAFAKYICSPHMGLARVMSFLLWLPRVGVHWEVVRDTLHAAGLKTAAWAMLGWYCALAPKALQPELARLRDTLRPGRLRSAYLEFWLRHNLPSRLIGHALAIQLGLVAFLHDRPSDALAAYRGWFASRRSRARHTRDFGDLAGAPA